MIFQLTLFVEIVCLSFALFLIRRFTGFWLYLLLYLIITVITELGGYAWVFVLNHQSNHWIYTAYLPLSTFLISAVLHQLTSSVKLRSLIISGYVLFFIGYLYEVTRTSFTSYPRYSNLFISLVIALVCLVWYYQLLKDEKYVQLISYPPFWIVSGLFLFYFGSTACNLFFTYLVDINKGINKPVRGMIFTVLNFIFYGCWAFAILCRYRRKISYSSS